MPENKRHRAISGNKRHRAISGNKRRRAIPDTQPSPPRKDLARLLARSGCCSRSEAERRIRAGRVAVDGRLVFDPALRLSETARILLDGVPPAPLAPIYLMLNKPRGLVTTAADEKGRESVYACLPEGLDWIAPVGRLDRASEGLLLFSNDSRWAARLMDPATHLDKTYRVHCARVPDAAELDDMRAGVAVGEGTDLGVKSVRLLRQGSRTAWLEIVLDEGRNRQIRRICEALDIEVLRLLRVAIGPLVLGDLAKGATRPLSAAEVAALMSVTPAAPPRPGPADR
jgi:23S rRNA pseudouridine2605 synthase